MHSTAFWLGDLVPVIQLSLSLLTCKMGSRDSHLGLHRDYRAKERGSAYTQSKCLMRFALKV